EELVRNGGHELAEEKDVERAHQRRQCDTDEGVGQLEAVQNQISRDHRDLNRDHQSRQHEHEQRFFAAESKLGERISGHDHEEQAYETDEHDDDGVYQVAAEIEVLE